MSRHDQIWGFVDRRLGAKDVVLEPCGLAHKLASIAYDNLNGESGEVDLIITLIIRAAKDRDLEFFRGDWFEQYCTLLGLNHIFVKELINGMWDYLDGNKNLNLEVLK